MLHPPQPWSFWRWSSQQISHLTDSDKQNTAGNMTLES